MFIGLLNNGETQLSYCHILTFSGAIGQIARGGVTWVCFVWKKKAKWLIKMFLFTFLIMHKELKAIYTVVQLAESSLASTCTTPGICTTKKEAVDYSRPLSFLSPRTQSSPTRGKAQVKHDEEPLTANPLLFHCVTVLIECISRPTTPFHPHMFEGIGFSALNTGH